MNNEIMDDITKTTIGFLLKEPFYGHFFINIVKEVSTSVNTAAVAPSQHSVKLIVNPDFWSGLGSKEHKSGIIKHEILHIVLKHILRMNSFSNKLIFNIAADIVVNQFLSSEQLFENAVTLNSFPSLNLEKEMDIKYYYDKLLTIVEEYHIMYCICGNCQCSSLFKGYGIDIEKHKLWKDFDLLSNPEKNIIDVYINEYVCNAVERNKHYGLLPGSLKSYLTEIQNYRNPIVNWKRLFRIYVTSSIKTYLKNSIKRPSKRYGTIPGIKIKRKNKMLIAIDTSASISNDELSEFFLEVYHIFKTGSEILIIECDTNIRKKYFYNGTTPDVVLGRGGTNFDEPLQYANNEFLPDLFIYFTDGFGPIPKGPIRYPLIWVITMNGLTDNEWIGFPGKMLRMQII